MAGRQMTMKPKAAAALEKLRPEEAEAVFFVHVFSMIYQLGKGVFRAPAS
jgi:hypothetical protein